jgi:DNA polymerase III epsilon subunit-like protein
MYLFFDTETTGLPLDWKAPVTKLNNWPRLVQIAYLLYDQEGNQLAAGNAIIRPEGFTIPAEASAVHGITTERALHEGIALATVLRRFEELTREATCLVAHNMAFDEKILGAEFLRAGFSNPLPAKRKICTMESTIDLCAIKGRYGYKWPKLSELHCLLFQCDFDGAHDASADIAATAKCFWELRRRGHL